MASTSCSATARWCACRPRGTRRAISRFACGSTVDLSCSRQTPATSAARCANVGCRATCTTEPRCWPRSTGWNGWNKAAHASSSAMTPRSGRACRRRRIRSYDFQERVMTYPTHLLPTTVVGSYPQPDWLVNRSALEQHGVPRTHAHDIWRIPAELLEQAQDDGTILAIRDMERAGIDIITDGEIRRESYSNRFALALDGIDADVPGEVTAQFNRATPVPRVVGKIRRRMPVELRDVQFLLRQTDQASKITLPG